MRASREPDWRTFAGKARNAVSLQVLHCCHVACMHILIIDTMQLFMWQHDIVGVAHFIQDCFEVLGALDDAPDDASTSSSSALAAG